MGFGCKSPWLLVASACSARKEYAIAAGSLGRRSFWLQAAPALRECAFGEAFETGGPVPSMQFLEKA